MEKTNTLNIQTPKDWRRIHPDYYKQFSIIDNPDSPCEYGFAIERKNGNGYDVVSIFNYGELGTTFINELKKHLDKLSKNSNDVEDINNYISENAEGYAVKQTESLKPIFYKSGTLVGKKVFINIMKIATNLGESFALQIFVTLKNNVYCFSTSSANVVEKDPLNSFINDNEYVKTMVNQLIKNI